MPILVVFKINVKDGEEFHHLAGYPKIENRDTKASMEKPVLRDRFGRTINYMRISVTDRCNFRCVYCMPPEGIRWRPHEEILSFEEIVQVVQVAAGLGINRIRLTGGEPLVRRGLSELVRAIAAIPGIQDLSLTTNASLLEDHAQALAGAGLTRVNISLDTLDAEKFQRITRGGSLEKVLHGIQAAEASGLAPIKINVVTVRGLNDDELIKLAELTYEHDWQVRFIELMPVGNLEDWGSGFPPSTGRYFSIQEMRTVLAPLDLQPEETVNGNGPAKVYRARGALGTLGFISPLGEHFCATCNRLRLTADGNLRACLLMDGEIPIRDVLRSGDDIRPYLQQAIELKPEGHELILQHFPILRKMAQIGG